jgi:hypothetical protein
MDGGYYLADWDDVLKAALPRRSMFAPIRLSPLHSGKSNASQDAILRFCRNQSLPLKELYKLFGYRGTPGCVIWKRRLCGNSGWKRITRRGYNMIEIVRNPTARGEKSRELYDYLKSQPGAILVEELPAPFQNAAR